MSFNATLVLKNRLDADVTFVELNKDSKTSNYTRADGVVGLPTNLQIAHNNANPGAKGNDKHLVKITRTRLSATGQVLVDTINITSSVAREGYTREDWLDMFAMAKSFLVEDNIDKLHRGEN